MPRLKKIENTVVEILENYPRTRGDDWLLLKVYLEKTIDTSVMSFATVCDHHDDLGLPSFESIRRCRQKIQAQRPELVDAATAKKRRKLIDDYKDYAKV